MAETLDPEDLVQFLSIFLTEMTGKSFQHDGLLDKYIGDAVNLGSRIETLNKLYGTHILLSEYTYAQVRDEFTAIREIDVSQVRGRHQPVRLYELIPEGTYPNLDWLGDFSRAYGLFHAGRVQAALPIFERLAQQLDDPVSRYYLQRNRSPRRLAGDES